jgi:hypothetical protein
MSQLRLAYVNCSIVPNRNATSIRRSSPEPANSPASSQTSFGRKADRLQALKPHAAAVLEGIVDELIWEAEGRKL